MYLPVRALRQADTINGTEIPTGTTTYLPLTDADSLADAEHITIVGSVTPTNRDTVIHTGGTVTTHSTELKVDATAAELRTRSTGTYTPAPAKTSMALKTADATKDRTSLVACDNTTGAYTVIDGTLATAGQSKPPACPEGSTPIAEVLVKATATEPSTITDVRPRA